MENLGFKPTAALGGEAEKADEVGVRGGHPSGADLQGRQRGREVIQPGAVSGREGPRNWKSGLLFPF